MEEIDKMVQQNQFSNKSYHHRRSIKKITFKTKGKEEFFPTQPNQKEYFCNNATKNFQKRDNQSTFGKRQIITKLLFTYLKERPGNRGYDTIENIVNIFSEQRIFPQFGNNKKNSNKYRTACQSQEIFHEQSKSQNLLKIYQGKVLLFKSDNRRNKQNQLKKTKEKGELVQAQDQFCETKKFSAKAIQKTFLLSLPYHIYKKNITKCQQNKIIAQMLKKTVPFSSFTIKEIQTLLKIIKEKEVCYRQILFSQGNLIGSNEQRNSVYSNSPQNSLTTDDKLMYFVIEGEISVMKRKKRKPVQICTVGEGNFVGEQAIFLEEIKQRKYTATVLSLQTKVLEISLKGLQDWMRQLAQGVTLDSIIPIYKRIVKQKIDHYEDYLNKYTWIKSSIFTVVGSKSLSSEKRSKLKNISNIVSQISQQVQGMEKITMKRLNFKNSSNEVSFEEPLFTRKDFPQIQSYLKRFQNQEKRALQKLKQNYSLHKP